MGERIYHYHKTSRSIVDVVFSTEENSILLLGKKETTYIVPRRCYVRLNEVIDATCELEDV